MSGYDALALRVAESDVDLVVAELWALGTLGLETTNDNETVVLRAYFPPGELDPVDWATGPRPVGGRHAEVLSLGALGERDWLAEYRRRALPFALGSGFWVDPGEPDVSRESASAPVGRSLLRLPARTAFGTGSHESTQLVVECLESMAVAGRRVLDVGSGSGVLSLVAVRLGAASVVALESDLSAVPIALDNQRLNRVSFPVFAGRIQALSSAARFDLVVVNVIPEDIGPDLPAIASRLRQGARAVFSGCLAEHAQAFLEVLECHSFRLVATRDQGDWRALSMERSGP